MGVVHRSGHAPEPDNSRMVGKPYLGITARLPVIRAEAGWGHPVRERSGIPSGVMLSSRFSFDSCCSLSVMASILTKVTSSGATCPAALPTSPEELLAPAQSK
jgi:hypothetical protein